MNVVITGSSKGIGFSLTKEFLKCKDQVIISSRNEANVNKALDKLKAEFPDAIVFGMVCDVTDSESIMSLVNFALEKMGEIDIWVNNAGTTGFEYDNLVNVSDKAIKLAITTNMLGTLFGSREAIKIMSKQKKGKIFNLAGYGTNGMASPNLAAYGSSKASMKQLNKTLVKETKDENIGIHLLSPGMVLTDLLLRNATPEAKKFFNITADRAENVAEYLVPRMRKIKGTGKEIKYSSMLKMLWKFMTAGIRKNNFFDEEGNFIEQ